MLIFVEPIGVLLKLITICALSLASFPAYAEGVIPFAAGNQMFHSYGDSGADWTFPDPRIWTGGDSTYSIVLPDGRTIWMFSDTFLSPTNGCGPTAPEVCHSRSSSTSLVNNSFVIQEGEALRQTLHGGTIGQPTALIRPPLPHNLRSFYWMGDATVENNQLLVFVRRFPVMGTLPPSAEAIDIAVFSLPDLNLIRIEQGVSEHGLQSWGFVAPGANSRVPITWGAAILETVEFTYVYGTEEYPLFKNLHVARAPAGQLLSAPWEYFDGTGWSSIQTLSQSIMSEVAGELSVAKVSDGYRLITSQLGIGDIYLSEAPQPEGPWTSPLHVYSPPESAQGNWAYNAHEHPQLAAKDSIVVSYNVNGSFEDALSDVHLYRPRFIQIPV